MNLRLSKNSLRLRLDRDECLTLKSIKVLQSQLAFFPEKPLLLDLREGLGLLKSACYEKSGGFLFEICPKDLQTLEADSKEGVSWIAKNGVEYGIEVDLKSEKRGLKT